MSSSVPSSWRTWKYMQDRDCGGKGEGRLPGNCYVKGGVRAVAARGTSFEGFEISVYDDLS